MTDRFLAELKTHLTDTKEKSMITADESKFIFNLTPTLATFHALPKIHKMSRLIPGRPIVSGCDNLTQAASKYIYEILCPFVTTLPSNLQNTKNTVSNYRRLQ